MGLKEAFIVGRTIAWGSVSVSGSSIYLRPNQLKDSGFEVGRPLKDLGSYYQVYGGAIATPIRKFSNLELLAFTAGLLTAQLEKFVYNPTRYLHPSVNIAEDIGRYIIHFNPSENCKSLLIDILSANNNIKAIVGGRGQYCAVNTGFHVGDVDRFITDTQKDTDYWVKLIEKTASIQREKCEKYEPIKVVVS